MIELKPPTNLKQALYDSDYQTKIVFLAGSIEMGKADDWQTKVKEALSDKDVMLLNPRRDDWDNTQEQKASNPYFNEQVNWELFGIENADIVAFYFDPNTISPITLAELGYCIGVGADIIVCCPDGYFRKGNVDIMCTRNGIRVFNTLDELINKLEKRLR